MRRRRVLGLTLLASALGVACAGAAEPARSPSPAPRADARPVAEAPRPPEPPPAAPAPDPTRAVTIGAGGDVLVHLKVIRSAREHADRGGFAHVLGGLTGVITPTEIAFANLETPLSMRIDPETGNPPVMGAPGEVARALAATGIDVVSVANNHSYDQTAAGLDDTLTALAEAEVLAAGASADPARAHGPVFIERDGVRVAFVAFTERVNRGPATQGEYVRVARYDDDVARAALAEARGAADVVVLSIHWSHDFIDSPRIAQRRRARLLVDAGADLIVGHGPHVLQEVERVESPRGEAVVAYSLGNLLSNQGMRYWAGRRIPDNVHPAVVIPQTRDGAWLRTRFALEDDRVVVSSVEAVPLWTLNNFMDVALRGAERLEIRAGPLRAASEAIQAERRPVIAAALGDAATLVD